MTDYSKLDVLRLTEDVLTYVNDFDCGDEDLNEFLKRDSLTYLKGKIAVTYLLVDDKRLIGFFCLSNDAVEIQGKDKKELKRQGKNQKTYPSMKIGRLGVSKTEWHKGIGTFLLKQAVGIALLQSEKAGCRYVTVDAYNRDLPVRFYAGNGFEKLSIKEERPNIPMYMDLLEYSSPQH